MSESDLETLNSVRFIYGFVKIKSNEIKSVKFLRNLEKIYFNIDGEETTNEFDYEINDADKMLIY